MSQEPTGQELILSGKGEAYKSEKSATHGMTQRKMSAKEYEVVPHGEGFAIKMRQSEPIKSQPVVQQPQTLAEMNKDMDAAEGIVHEAPPQEVVKEETFHWVRFQEKASADAQENVELSVNGETLVMKRNRPVIVPSRFLECADHAVVPIFKQLPNQPRKITGKVKTFPYERITDKGSGGMATQTEFMTMMRTGTQKTRADLERYGIENMPTDDED